MQDLAAELDTEGHAIVRGFLSPTEIAAIGAETDRMYRKA